jgi:hypothetical protein
MTKVILVVIFILLAAPVYAIVGIAVGARGGVAPSVDLTATHNIPGLDLDKMNIVGLQFKFGGLPKIDLIFTADYYWKSKFFIIPLSSQNVEITVHNLALTASAVYPIYKSQLITPYVGFGIASHALTFSGKGTWGTIVVPPDDTRFGYQLIGGAYLNLPIIPVIITGEGRINWIKTEDEKSHFISLTLSANFGVL